MALRFVDLTKDELDDDCRFVKSLGDAVLVVAPEPSSGVALCERILARIDAEPNFPIPRTGIHHGPAVERDGDFFGGSVNLTARVAAQAHGGQVLGTEIIAEHARHRGLHFVDLGTFCLKNLADDVRLFDIHVGPRVKSVVIDPVCRMQVDMEGAAGRLRVDDVDYWFCSLDCAARFIRDRAQP